MNFASVPKFAFLLALAAVLILAFAGCGSSDNVSLAQGNWSVAATSTATALTHGWSHQGLFQNQGSASFYIGGNLTQNGSSLAGTMYVVGSECFNSAGVAFTGTVSGHNVTLTTDSPSLAGQVITVTGNATSTSSITGTYTVKGGCDDGDSGTVTASVAVPITGTWAGQLSNCGGAKNGCTNATISIGLTQAGAAAADGGFPLTGSVTYTGSVCSTSGTVSGGEVYGSFLVVNANTVDQGDQDGSFTYSQVLLNNPSAPTSMTGSYQVNEGECTDQQQTLTMSTAQ